jgi:hypothetical protein
VPPLALRLACALSGYFNSETGEAWPAKETLAGELGATERGVRKAVAALVVRGHLDVTAGGGREITKRYRSLSKTRNSRSGFKQKPGTQATENPERKRPKTRNGRSPESIEEPIDISKGERDNFTPTPINEKNKEAVDGEFIGWWSTYPRHVAKGAAAKAYQRILANDEATADQLLAGAARYAAERQGQDERYTKHPATWLNGKCWLDEPSLLPATGGHCVGWASVLKGLASIPDGSAP